MTMERIGRSSALVVAIVLALAAGLLTPVAAADAASGGADTTEFVPGHVVVGLAPGTPASVARSLADDVGADIVRTIPALDVQVLDLGDAVGDRVLRRLERHGAVSYVERDVVVEAAGERIPDDPEWSKQWSPPRTAAPEAWTATTGSADVVVAVLDTGVDANHEDLGGALVAGRNIIDGDSDTTDHHGHGTSAAGIVGARSDNGLGVASYCWTCSIMPVKVLGDDGSGRTSDVAAGIVWATDNGADVINLSLGGSSGTTSMLNAVRYATDNDVLVVASAGNNGEEEASYPAAYAEVVGVAGTDQDDVRYSWSNYGSDVDVAAPGCNRTTVRGDHYGNFCGTSSAAPVVAGIAGLVAAAHPGATVEHLRSALTDSAVDVGSIVVHGRVDASGAVTHLDGVDDGSDGGDGGDTSDEDTDGTVIERIAGSDRIGTAVALSRTTFADGASTVVLARADDYPDALAGASLARALDAPILLTTQDGLASDVRDEVERLDATRAVLLGSSGALSDQVRRDLEKIGVSVVRHGGADRFATARAVGTALADAGGDTSHAYLVLGAHVDPSRGWPDAVAVAGLAALQGHPILLTHSDHLPADTAATLDDLDVTHVTIVGGRNAVSKEVVAELSDLGLNVQRVAGADRYETSRDVADLAVRSGVDVSRVWLATGRNFPDALAAGPAVAAGDDLLLLVDGQDVDRSPATRDWLADHADDLSVVRLVGGTGVISSSVEFSIQTLSE